MTVKAELVFRQITHVRDGEHLYGKLATDVGIQIVAEPSYGIPKSPVIRVCYHEHVNIGFIGGVASGTRSKHTDFRHFRGVLLPYRPLKHFENSLFLWGKRLHASIHVDIESDIGNLLQKAYVLPLYYHTARPMPVQGTSFTVDHGRCMGPKAPPPPEKTEHFGIRLAPNGCICGTAGT